jgi:hypothetical protein
MRMPGYFTVILMPLALIWSFEAAAQQASEGGLRKTAFGIKENQPSGMLENHCGDGGKPAVVRGAEITSETTEIVLPNFRTVGKQASGPPLQNCERPSE